MHESLYILTLLAYFKHAGLRKFLFDFLFPLIGKALGIPPIIFHFPISYNWIFILFTSAIIIDFWMFLSY